MGAAIANKATIAAKLIEKIRFTISPRRTHLMAAKESMNIDFNTETKLQE